MQTIEDVAQAVENGTIGRCGLLHIPAKLGKNFGFGGGCGDLVGRFGGVFSASAVSTGTSVVAWVFSETGLAQQRRYLRGLVQLLRAGRCRVHS